MLARVNGLCMPALGMGLVAQGNGGASTGSLATDEFNDVLSPRTGLPVHGPQASQRLACLSAARAQGTPLGEYRFSLYGAFARRSAVVCCLPERSGSDDAALKWQSGPGRTDGTDPAHLPVVFHCRSVHRETDRCSFDRLVD